MTTHAEGAEPQTDPREAGAPSTGQYLGFVIEEKLYALPIGDVLEIISMQRIIRVPTVPPFLRGVINLRGTVIPVVDVRVRLGLDPSPPSERSCIVVVRSGEYEVGLVVDAVAEVLDIQADRIQPAARTSADASAHVVRALGLVGERVAILLDLGRLLGHPREADGGSSDARASIASDGLSCPARGEAR